MAVESDSKLTLGFTCRSAADELGIGLAFFTMAAVLREASVSWDESEWRVTLALGGGGPLTDVEGFRLLIGLTENG